MTPVRKPWKAWMTRPASRYSAGSRRSARSTAGVIQPAHTLSRGNWARSSTTTSAPAARSAQAQAEPAGPPPTIRTSARRTRISGAFLRVDLGAGPVRRRGAGRREDDLIELQPAGRERGFGAGEIEVPRAVERVADRFADLPLDVLEALPPVHQRAGVVQAQVVDVEDGELRALEDRLLDLRERRRMAAREDAPRDPRVERTRPIAPDEVQQAASVHRIERPPDRVGQRVVLTPPDVPEPADRHEHVEAAVHVAVVLFAEPDPTREAFPP